MIKYNLDNNAGVSHIITKAKFWRDYNGTGDEYRKEHDLDCVLTGGNLYADTIFSLWLPLRQVLNYYDLKEWKEWKDYEASMLRPKRLGLKNHEEFLNALIDDTEAFLPLDAELTILLCELFRLGQQRCNVMILPYRKWNNMRGGAPYWEYLPHFLYDLLSTESPLFLEAVRQWIKDENLEMFFEKKILDKEHIRDLTGTGAVWKHAPKDIDIKIMIENYIEILKERDGFFED